MTGLEPVTSSLPRRCSTAELHGRLRMWSGKRDSNSQPSAWKADALPIELFPLGFGVNTEEKDWGELDLNQRRLSRRVYSPLPLTARASPQKKSKELS